LQPFLHFLARWGYLVLFGTVLAEQVGIPVPSVPALLAMGAVAGLGHASIWVSLMLATVAALLGDAVWYDLGRRKGYKILNLLCRISLEPDSCVSNTKDRWDRFGGYTLLFSKFIPGLSTVAPPLAGLSSMSFSRYLAIDLLGSMLWAGAYLGAGYLFRNQFETVVDRVGTMGRSLTMLVFGPLAIYIGWKYYNRRRFIRELRVARVTPEELLDMINAGEDVTVVDLRNRRELEAEGTRVPTAIWMDIHKLEEETSIPRDKEVVLYCS
jgi:membrane protein DedA with SNARE-associated domain